MLTHNTNFLSPLPFMTHREPLVKKIDLFHPFLEPKNVIQRPAYPPSAVKTLPGKVASFLWPSSMKSTFEMVNHPLLIQNIIS